jgi:L-ribulose-5-phosphate 3-epimerase
MKNYVLGVYEKSMPSTLCWTEKLSVAQKSGFDFIEMSIDETDEKLVRLDMSKEERRELRSAMVEAELPIRSLCLSGHRKYSLGHPDGTVRQRSLEIMQKAVWLAADLGIRTIQLAGYDVYYEQSTAATKAFFTENLHICAAMAAKEGILLGFETMETPFMDTVTKAIEYVKLVNSPYLGVYPDAGNLTNASLLYGQDLVQDIKNGAGHIVAFHLKETVPGKYREIPFGTGHVDFAQIAQTTWSLGVRRYVAEFWYTGQKNWQKDLVYANQFHRKFFAQIKNSEGIE